MPKEYLFNYDKAHRDKYEYLFTCREKRNDVDNWLTSCQPLCENFNVVQLKTFFDGHIKKSFNYINFANQRIKEIEIEANKKPMFDFDETTRVLEEEKTDDEKQKEKLEEFLKKSRVTYQHSP